MSLVELVASCARHPDFYFAGKCPACAAEESAVAVTIIHDKRINYRGESLSLKEWGLRLGIGHRTLEHRLHAGWTVRQAFETPLGQDRDGLT